MAVAGFVQAAAEMLGAAMVYSPDGMMQVGNDLSQTPVALQNVANALYTMTKRSHEQDPIHPAIIDQMQKVCKALQDAAKLAEDLGPAFKHLHAVDIQRIQQPRTNEGKWDFAANKGQNLA